MLEGSTKHQQLVKEVFADIEKLQSDINKLIIETEYFEKDEGSKLASQHSFRFTLQLLKPCIDKLSVRVSNEISYLNEIIDKR